MRWLISRKSHVVFLGLTLALATLFSSCTSTQTSRQPTRDPQSNAQPFRLNINRASAKELERLPHIGPSLARRIIEHRERYGPFRTVEQLMLLDGVSEKRFRELSPYLTVD
ncbi:MAG TPA: ComEA family DNA-binding protein [Pyrinomonadaceae bacterium]